MSILTSGALAQDVAIPSRPASLAIYYGYPSLVNGAGGDVGKAAPSFSVYDVVVLGDGLEFEDRQEGRYPQGDPTEHRKTAELISRVHQTNPRVQFYGYVCLGDIAMADGKTIVLAQRQLEERIELWRQMGVAGIFLDEAGYDFRGITRERQNATVRYIHQLGLSAFVNAYFVDHLFSQEPELPYSHGNAKNPQRQATALDGRDILLLESFQVKNGEYESYSACRDRVLRSLAYRKQYGTRVFATTTSLPGQGFESTKFDYAWWSARLFGVDGFSWGEPGFAATNNSLPDRRRRLPAQTLAVLEKSPAASSNETKLWIDSPKFSAVVNGQDHSVRVTVGVMPFSRKRSISQGALCASPTPFRCLESRER